MIDRFRRRNRNGCCHDDGSARSALTCMDGGAEAASRAEGGGTDCARGRSQRTYISDMRCLSGVACSLARGEGGRVGSLALSTIVSVLACVKVSSGKIAEPTALSLRNPNEVSRGSATFPSLLHQDRTSHQYASALHISLNQTLGLGAAPSQRVAIFA